jgi:Protein of unknown function (DUF3078)
MFKFFPFLLALCFFCNTNSQTLQAQTDTTKNWKIGGGIGIDFSQLLLINPKIGAGENRIGIGGNTSFYANYSKGRVNWKNNANINFAVQKLGRGANSKPFQKSLDELRFNSTALVALDNDHPYSYALDIAFLSQLTPTYTGNLLAPIDSLRATMKPIAKLFSPATFVISPGFSYKPDNHLFVMISPASLKLITVGDDAIAQLSNAAGTSSLHGNPLGRFASEDAFRASYHVKAKMRADSVYYANNFIQLGATLKANYQNKFLKDAAGKPRLGVNTTLTLFTNYLRQAQNIDVEWITQTDFYIFKGLSLTVITNLFYDHDILVQVDRDKNINTGNNGYESTGRRVSFTQSLLLKYNFLF